MPPLPNAKNNTAQRIRFSKVSADTLGTTGIDLSENNFHIEVLLEPIVWRSCRGQVCIHYRCSSINAQDSNLVRPFSVYVHCASFSIHLGNFIKMKKSYNRYLAFDPLFALVWCPRLSNDTKHCATWLYYEITNWKDWAKKDFVSNKKGWMGLKENSLCFMLIQENKYVLMWNYILPIMESVREGLRRDFFRQSHPSILFCDIISSFVFFFTRAFVVFLSKLLCLQYPQCNSTSFGDFSCAMLLYTVAVSRVEVLNRSEVSSKGFLMSFSHFGIQCLTNHDVGTIVRVKANAFFFFCLPFQC